MKPKRFILTLLGLIAWMLLTFVLQLLFQEQTADFGFSCGACFLSVFCLFEYKNALKPTETIGPRNSTKKYYESKGDLPGYQKLCKILFIITLCVSAGSFLKGIAEVVLFSVLQFLPF